MTPRRTAEELSRVGDGVVDRQRAFGRQFVRFGDDVLGHVDAGNASGDSFINQRPFQTTVPQPMLMQLPRGARGPSQLRKAVIGQTVGEPLTRRLIAARTSGWANPDVGDVRVMREVVPIHGFLQVNPELRRQRRIYHDEPDNAER